MLATMLPGRVAELACPEDFEDIVHEGPVPVPRTPRSRGTSPRGTPPMTPRGRGAIQRSPEVEDLAAALARARPRGDALGPVLGSAVRDSVVMLLLSGDSKIAAAAPRVRALARAPLGAVEPSPRFVHNVPPTAGFRGGFDDFTAALCTALHMDPETHELKETPEASLVCAHLTGAAIPPTFTRSPALVGFETLYITNSPEDASSVIILGVLNAVGHAPRRLRIEGWFNSS